MKPRDRPSPEETTETARGSRNVRPGRLRSALLSWYERERRPLPWRRSADPYAIWVSEVMLQQTRVEAVVPRYARFLEAFPTAEALAAASEERVLSLWSGLGYYSRARNLRSGAKVVVERHGGRFPSGYREARQIPGVGTYTAAAVLSIAYGLPYAVVDGNVARVLARLFSLPGREKPASSRLQELAERLLSRERPGDHNQAMMELGALVCLPRAPRCPHCPVSFACRANREGRPDGYAPRSHREVVHSTHHLFVLRDRKGRLLLERGVWRLLPHLWLPPIRGPEDRPPPVAPGTLNGLGAFRHSITHHRLHFQVLGGRTAAGGRTLESRTFLEDAEIPMIGRSSILEKALRLEQEPRTAQARCGASGRRHAP